MNSQTHTRTDIGAREGVRYTPFEPGGLFRKAVDGGEVKRLAIRGAGVTVFSSGVSLAIQIIATIVLARLLTPVDFGLVAMVTTFSLLLTNFGLNGFTEAILQRPEMDRLMAGNIFWINVGASLSLMLGFAGSGYSLARFYHDPLVERVVVGMSLTILISGSSVVHLALLKRAMLFSRLSANDVCSRITSVFVSILLAWAGYGYWALVAGNVAQVLAQSVGAWILCHWVPGRPQRVAGMGSTLRFAINVYTRFTFNYFGRNTDNLLMGWRFGAQTLGFYKRAYDLFALSVGQLTAPLTNVAVAALSRFEPGSVSYRQLLLNALAVMAFVGMAVGGCLTLIGQDVIRVLLGPKWEPAGRLFTFFGPGIGVMLLYYTHGWIHLSVGEANRWLRWGIVELVFTTFLFVVGLHWGPEGVAAAWTMSFWILLIPALWYAVKPIHLGIVPVIAAVWKYIFAAVVTVGVCAELARSLPFTASGMEARLVRIAITCLVFLALYLGSVILLHRGFAPIHMMAGIVREMISAKRSPATPAAVPATTETDTQFAFALKGDRSQPLVSILIPAFNAEQWIADTLRSAIAQTWEAKEIIVVDDGSSDRTVAIAQQLQSDSVRIITQNNQGAAAARNHAISLSKGDYIQFLDADDLLAPDKIALQMAAIREFGTKRTLFSSPFGLFLYRHRRAKFIANDLWCDSSPVDWLVVKMGQNLYMQTATWLVSRELAEAAGPWDTRLLSDDDGEYFCRVLLASDGVRFVPEAKVYYRGPGLAFGNLSHIGRSVRKLDAHWLSMRLHIGYLRSLEDSERVRAACVRYLQFSLLYFYPEQSGIVTEMEQTARSMGGELSQPRLSWKYLWMKTLFGWRLAKIGQQSLLDLRWTSQRLLDKTIFHLERSPSVPVPSDPAPKPAIVSGKIMVETVL